MGFETFEVSSLPDAVRVYLVQFFEDPIVGTVQREWQYDEFCLVSNFLIDPLPKVDILPVGSLEDVAKLVLDKIQQRKRKKVQVTADSE